MHLGKTPLLVAAGVLIAAGGGVAIGRSQAQQPVLTSWQRSLSQVPPHAAPGFALTDQRGDPVSLAALHGKAVALYFMDPRCTDICPIVAQEFIDADHDLGTAASQVALVGIDVNPGATARHWLTTFDDEHGLDQLPNWYFLSGGLDQLKSVWNAYNINVQLTKAGDVEHTTVIEFIDPDGQLRSLSAPNADYRNGVGYLPAAGLGQWGNGIAGQLRQLLTEKPGGEG